LTDARASFFARVDYQQRLAMVATDCPVAPGADHQAADEQIVAVARYDVIEAGRAEAAIVVEDRFQHRGVGWALFWALIEAARARGVKTFVANVLTENNRMLRLLQEIGLPLRRKRAGGYLAIDIDLTSSAGPP
jgi:GNAT superfamily N-acetyltransferase